MLSVPRRWAPLYVEESGRPRLVTLSASEGSPRYSTEIPFCCAQDVLRFAQNLS